MTLDGPEQLNSHMQSCVFQEDDMPEEVNIDDLIDLPNNEERVRKLQVTLCLRFRATFQFIVMHVPENVVYNLPRHDIMFPFILYRSFFKSVQTTQRYVMQNCQHYLCQFTEVLHTFCTHTSALWVYWSLPVHMAQQLRFVLSCRFFLI